MQTDARVWSVVFLLPLLVGCPADKPEPGADAKPAPNAEKTGKAEKKRSEPVIAFVALADKTGPTQAAIVKALGDLLPEQKVTEADTKDGTITFTVAGNLVAVSLMPAPIPWSDLEGPCATAYWWPEATKVMKASPAHLIAVVMPGPGVDRIDASLLLTKAVAAAVASCKPAGVYWGDGRLVWSGDDFQLFAKEASREDLPVRIWIDFRVAPDERGGNNLVTTGLAPFGLMEIEVAGCKRKPSEMVELVSGFARYLLEKGPVLKHGETIGRSADEKFPITHEPSMWDKKRTVIRIGL